MPLIQYISRNGNVFIPEITIINSDSTSKIYIRDSIISFSGNITPDGSAHVGHYIYYSYGGPNGSVSGKRISDNSVNDFGSIGETPVIALYRELTLAAHGGGNNQNYKEK